MNIETKKSEIIERFKQIEDEALIDTIRNLLDYASTKEGGNEEIPEEHKKIVMERFNKVRSNPDGLMDWNEAKESLKKR
ncbi:MAG: hypothetical protein K9J27_07420 [Bacteroidales bacterium]|nr:hypothetical protein [Bacteroidales bacterium]MCF8333320.1 hypothetical protein [Bacteroidales bacterium]